MKKILVLTDFSSSARNAISYAAALAKEMKAKLLLFHSFQIQIPSPDFPVVTLTATELEKKSEKILQKEAANIQKRYQINAEGYAQSGFHTAEEILRITKKLKPDLVVMGMKEKGKITEVLIGSTATSVIKHIKRPVMIIPEKAEFIKPEKILLAFDYSTPAGLNVFLPLREIAKVFQSEIYIVNILENGASATAEKTNSYLKLDELFSGMRHIYYFPKSKKFSIGIDDFLKKHQAVLMAMVPHKHDLIERLFGKSNTKRMIFHTHIPLLILPDSYARHPTYFI